MKYLQLILWGLGIIFLAAGAGVVADEKLLSSDGVVAVENLLSSDGVVAGGVAVENLLSSDSDDGRAIYQAQSDFKCPLVFGVFSDPTDCAHYYVCVAGIASRRKCGFLRNFDVFRRMCLPILVAICGNDKTKTTPTTAVTATETAKIVDNFKCSKMFGSFPHPIDCSKYYTCTFYVASLKTCPENQLFDTGKSTCKPENEVNCDNRQRPGFTTTPIPTEPIITEGPEASTTEEEIIASTTEDIISTDDVTTETTTEVSSTTKVRPTGPPDHNCDEEDVDCIITETGDIEDWFICPRDIGSFAHPSSDRLFILCMNWIPSVKRCGQDLVYSKEYGTCIEKKY